jgi:hypothetical protein
MTKKERKHIQRMLDFANDQAKQKKPLTPQELADAIKVIKEKYPKDFPPTTK